VRSQLNSKNMEDPRVSAFYRKLAREIEKELNESPPGRQKWLMRKPFKARYLKRDPDPGTCVVLAIDWLEKRVTMSNGAHTYFPNFDEIEIWREK